MITKRGALATAVGAILLLSTGTAVATTTQQQSVSRAEALAALNEAQRQLNIVEDYFNGTTDPPPPPITQPPTTTTQPPITTTDPPRPTTTRPTRPTSTTRPPSTTTKTKTTTQAPPITTTTITPPPPNNGSTAAERFGWGTPIPEGSDEFNYTGAPDPKKWSTYNGPGHAGNGRRVAGNNQVVSGVLQQTGESDGDSAGMSSRLNQKYGRWEVRARSYATGQGGNTYHPVLILWPQSNEWPEGAEYDYLENGAPGEQCAEAYLHYPNHEPKRQEHAERCNIDLTQWHNFALEWKPNLLVGYIDGVEWFRFTGQVANAPGAMHQTIQLDNFAGSGMQPAKFEVDWARVYR